MSDEAAIEEVSWNLNRDVLSQIRSTVFIEEQGVSPEIEQDGRDADATHFLLSERDRPLACGRLLADGKIGRMAVLPDHRHRGLGGQLLRAMVDHAKRNGARRLYLHAQSHALAFYEAAGFTPFGEAFEEAGIPHAAMELVIDYSGADYFITGVEYPQPFATLALELAKTARRHIRIYSPTLDHAVFDDSDLASAMTALVTRGRHSDIRILVSDARPMVQQGHRLLSLSRRLSSTIAIRVLSEHPELPEASYLVRDNSGVVYKPDDRGRPGFYEPDSRASAKRFVEGFDALWRLGEVDPRLRRLVM